MFLRHFQRHSLQKKGSPKSCQHLEVNIVHLFFTQKGFLSRAFDPFDFPPFPTPDLLCAKILWFSIETCPFRGDIDVFFLAGVMIWWIRISKPGDNTCIHACFLCVPFVAFCLVVQILISQMNTNIYSVNVWAQVTSDAFQTSLCRSSRLQRQDAPMWGRRDKSVSKHKSWLNASFYSALGTSLRDKVSEFNKSTNVLQFGENIDPEYS